MVIGQGLLACSMLCSVVQSNLSPGSGVGVTLFHGNRQESSSRVGLFRLCLYSNKDKNSITSFTATMCLLPYFVIFKY